LADDGNVEITGRDLQERQERQEREDRGVIGRRPSIGSIGWVRNSIDEACQSGSEFNRR
jgi:hypothetical protein